MWGGEDGSATPDRVDGFAVDLETRSVTAIPAAPISRSGGGDGVWTGSELVVWSTGEGEAAAWDPTERSWRTVATPPIEARATPGKAVWAGDRIVVAATGGSVSYDPAADVWTTIPDVPDLPGQGPAPELAWTGEEVVAWVIGDLGGPADEGGVVADVGWSWRPGDDRWAPLPELPVGSRIAYGSMGWTGSQVIVWGRATGGDELTVVGTGAVWEPGTTDWRPLAPSPQGRAAGFEGTQGSQVLAADPVTGRVLVHPLDLDGGLAPRETYLYDPVTDTWSASGVTFDDVAPPVTFHDGLVLQPDPAAPIAHRL